MNRIITGTVPSTGLNYRCEGASDAPYLVLANSLGTDLGMWAPQMAAFRERFNVLRFDARGHGKSPVAPGPYSIAQIGEDLLSLLEHVGAKRVYFCGLSIGGMVGLWLARHHPEALLRIVVCNTGATIGTPDAWNGRIDKVNTGGMPAITEMVLDRWFTPKTRASAPKDVEVIRDMLLRTSAEGYVATSAAIRDASLGDLLHGIEVPTLVISGSEDLAAPPEGGRQIARSVKGSHHVELPAAHLSNWECSEQFSSEVLKFCGW